MRKSKGETVEKEKGKEKSDPALSSFLWQKKREKKGKKKKKKKKSEAPSVQKSFIDGNQKAQ